ncbi:MAG: hypothetical protein RIR79_1544 [Pseudomonadota bacterium]|jgi:hypothetical protein
MNTNNQNNQSGVLLASLLLPGLAALALAPTAAQAEGAPEKTTVAFKLGSYQDSQAGWDRVTATAPQLYIQAPIASDWSIEASAVRDNVSGATPYFHTQKTGASGGGQVGMKDERNAGDVRITHYLARSAYSASVAVSSEHDYKSTAIGLDGRWSSEDNNTTWTAGFGASNDTIDNTHSGINTAIDQKKTTREIMVGVTQVLTSTDIVQFNLTRGVGSGYFNDPYKMFENRPDTRNTWIALARWNHYVEGFDAALRTSYRYYSDTFGVQSHTLGVDWVQPYGKWTFTPGVRYYHQKAADFFIAPVLDAQGQYDMAATMTATMQTSGFKSADQRLSGFGALTWSLKTAYAINSDTSVDFKIETYRQSGNNLDTFNAQFYQIGITHRF